MMRLINFIINNNRKHRKGTEFEGKNKNDTK
jgi:hypothetical protein